MNEQQRAEMLGANDHNAMLVHLMEQVDALEQRLAALEKAAEPAPKGKK